MELLHQRLGLINPYDYWNDYETVQGDDYVNSRNPNIYGQAWVVRDAIMSSSNASGHFLYEQTFSASLIFGGGPNVGSGGKARGSRKRTKSIAAVEGFRFFCECLRACIDVTLDAMIGEGITVAILARTSCGIQAGDYYSRIQKMFAGIVNGSLSTVITNE